jgi:uncharacterized YccA/Bax inhibitor family protein
MQLKSKNPFFKKSFAQEATIYRADGSQVIDYNETMTVSGTVNKSFILFGLLLLGATIPVYLALAGKNIFVPAIAGAIIGFALVIACTFSPKNSRYLAPAYALFEGVFVGAVSIIFELRYPGVVVQGVLGTLVTFGVCLALYRFGIVKVNQQFRSIVIAATMAIGTYYLVSMLFYWIGGISLFHHGNSLMSIGFSIVVIILAAMNLIMDFDNIELGAAQRMPKYMEWYSSMGLIITLVWLYLEFLRLLSKLQSRN